MSIKHTVGRLTATAVAAGAGLALAAGVVVTLGDGVPDDTAHQAGDGVADHSSASDVSSGGQLSRAGLPQIADGGQEGIWAGIWSDGRGAGGPAEGIWAGIWSDGRGAGESPDGIWAGIWSDGRGAGGPAEGIWAGIWSDGRGAGESPDGIWAGIWSDGRGAGESPDGIWAGIWSDDGDAGRGDQWDGQVAAPLNGRVHEVAPAGYTTLDRRWAQSFVTPVLYEQVNQAPGGIWA